MHVTTFLAISNVWAYATEASSDERTVTIRLTMQARLHCRFVQLFPWSHVTKMLTITIFVVD